MTSQLSAFLDLTAARLRFLPWRRGLRRIWQAGVAVGLALLGLGVLAWLTLQWGILPHIEDWRPEIERHASRAVGVPVRIGAIRVRSSGWVPALELRDVVLRDASGAEALRLPRVAAALSPRSLLALQPRLAQLYVEDARLLIRRDANGHLHVGGLDLAASVSTLSSADESATLDWIFSQTELVLRHGTVRWVDEQRAAPALELSDVDLVLRNGLRAHELRLDATPPAAWGERASLRARCSQPLFAHPGDWRRWRGTVYAELPRADVAQLARQVELPFELDGGQAALRLWVDFQRDQWRSAVADVRLRDVGLRLARDAAPLAIVQAGGRLSAQRDADGVALTAERFGFETGDGIVWPADTLHVEWQQAQASVAPRRRWFGAAASAPASAAPAPLLWDRGAPVTGGRFTADRLDFTLMRRVAAALPLPASARRWLDEYRPEGVVQPLSAQWSGPIGAPDSYRVAGSGSGLSLAAGSAPLGGGSARPGWRNARLDFDARETGGSAHVILDGGALDLPGVLEAPRVPLDRFAATVDWRLEGAPAAPSSVSVAVRDVRFANADLEGELQLRWRTGPRKAAAGASAPDFGRGARLPGVIDLQGTLAHADASRLARYLPLGVGPDTRSYLGAAFRSGALRSVAFKVRGDLAAFPYAHPRDDGAGEFRVAGRVADLTLDYAPAPAAADGSRGPSPWPVFTQVAGEVALDRGRLEIRDASGRMGDVQLSGLHAAVPNLYDQPVMSLQGQARGPAAEFLRYVAQSPVGGWLHQGLATTTAGGAAALELSLAIPLQRPQATTVAGTFTLPGNDVRFGPGAPVLSDARARVEFTDRGATVSGGSAVVIGGAASFDGGSQPDGSLRFAAQGTASADGLRRAAGSPALARLAQSLSGQAPYRLQVDIARGQTAFVLTSPLSGLGLKLPAPLGKPPDASWPLRVATAVSFDAQGKPRDTLRVDLGPPQSPLLQADVLRDLSGPAPRPLQAAYAIGTPMPAPLPGGLLALGGPSLDGDAWISFLRDAKAPAAAASAASAPPEVPPADGEPTPGYFPSAIALRTPDLRIGGRHLANVDIRVARVEEGGEEVWRSAVASDQTKGVVEYRPETPARGAQLFARLDRLAFDGRDGAAQAPVRAAPSSPPSWNAANSVPALDVVVDDFELDGRQLGKLEVGATLQSGGRDWRLTRLKLTTPEARLSGTGRWSDEGAGRRMAIDFGLEIDDAGALLGRLGAGRLLKGGKGRLDGAVAWNGSPFSLDYPSLQGRLQLSLDRGQFLKVDAGAGRLLGVLSLQSLARRLTLDFRDLFDEGFAFDNVSGDVQIDRGVASTRDLRMRGLSVAVLMSGRSDLRAETQDLDVIVLPEVNAGAASLAYAAINPIIGIGTFLAQLFLRDPLTAAGTREFHVTGSWADPKIDPVEHKAAVAAAAEAASQARAAEKAERASAAASAASEP
jgi:uncharacterized protein (TIGR02099 family)